MIAPASDRLLIEDDARVGRAEQAVIGAMLGCLVAFPLLPHTSFAAIAVVFWGLTAVSIYKRLRAAAHVGIFFSVCFAALLLRVNISQVWLGASIAIYALLVRLLPLLRGTVGWLRRGRADRVVIAIAAGFTVVAGLALLTWQQLFRPDLHDLLETYVPSWSLPLLLAGAVLLAIVNAAVEEVAYRGILQQSLGAAFGPTLALLGQAIAFGALHINGFPRGAVGVGLAIIYGLMIGFVRLRSRGLLVPWIAHIVTDATIYAIVLFLAR